MLANVSSAATALDPSIVRSRSRPALLDSVIIPWYSNLYIIAICLYSIWILAGLLFYYFVNDWGWATSFYFALQGGLSVGFCAPVEHTNRSRIFTVFYIIIGSSVVAGSLGKLASALVFTRVHVSGRKVFDTISEFLEHEEEPYVIEKLQYGWYRFKLFIGWYSHRQRVVLTIALIIWIGVGVVYGMVLENWDFIVSLYFAVSCLSTAGLQTPTCNGDQVEDCELSSSSGVYVGIYILVGVPLYAVAIGQFAGIAVEYAAQEKEKQMMMQPIEARDFQYAATLLSSQDSTTLELGLTNRPVLLGEFIILELMRLGIADRRLIKQITGRFKELDLKKNNVLDYDELRLGGYVIEGKLSRRFTQGIKFLRKYEPPPAAAGREGGSGGFSARRIMSSTGIDIISPKRGDGAAIPATRVKSDSFTVIEDKESKDRRRTSLSAENPNASIAVINADTASAAPTSLSHNNSSGQFMPAAYRAVSSTQALSNIDELITSSGVAIPMLPMNLRPHRPKAYDPNNDSSSSSEGSCISDNDLPGASPPKEVNRMRSETASKSRKRLKTSRHSERGRSRSLFFERKKDVDMAATPSKSPPPKPQSGSESDSENPRPSRLRAPSFIDLFSPR